jgi:hypothetical protein
MTGRTPGMVRVLLFECLPCFSFSVCYYILPNQTFLFRTFPVIFYSVKRRHKKGDINDLGKLRNEAKRIGAILSF